MTGSASYVSTHVLDTVRGRPAQDVPVSLESRAGSDWQRLAEARTDADGRVSAFGPERLSAGVYRVVFDTGAWFAAAGTESFYPEVAVVFRVDGRLAHLHIPLLLSPFAYSTYRGS